MPDTSLFAQAEQVSDAVVDRVLTGTDPLVLVLAPPGAGKTRTVRRLAVAATQAGVSAAVAVQTNAQGFDLVEAVAEDLRSAGTDRPVSYLPSDDVRPEVPATVTHHNHVEQLRTRDLNSRHGPVVIATAQKWNFTLRGPHRVAVHTDIGVVDEAYQTSAAQFYRIADLADRWLFIGDPGQLESFTVADDSRWEGSPFSPVQSAPDAVLNTDRTVPIERLPASLRLDHRAAPVVAECFYPTLDFEPIDLPGERSLTLHPGFTPHDHGLQAADAALDVAGSRGWSMLEVDRGPALMQDPAVVTGIVNLLSRLTARGATVAAPYPPEQQSGRALRGDDLAVAVAHRAQRGTVQQAVDDHGGLDDVVVDTANRLQGREFEVVIAWHPLSGRVDADEFHLETGRLCVMVSRHRQACVVVGRGGIGDVLAQHLPSGRRPLGAQEDREHGGWLAHQRFLDHLNQREAVVQA